MGVSQSVPAPASACGYNGSTQPFSLYFHGAGNSTWDAHYGGFQKLVTGNYTIGPVATLVQAATLFLDNQGSLYSADKDTFNYLGLENDEPTFGPIQDGCLLFEAPTSKYNNVFDAISPFNISSNGTSYSAVYRDLDEPTFWLSNDPSCLMAVGNEVYNETSYEQSSQFITVGVVHNGACAIRSWSSSSSIPSIAHPSALVPCRGVFQKNRKKWALWFFSGVGRSGFSGGKDLSDHSEFGLSEYSAIDKHTIHLITSVHMKSINIESIGCRVSCRVS